MGFLKRIRAAKAELHPGPYSISVEENLGFSGMGTTKNLRYRVVVTDANGAPAKVDYSMTYKTAYAVGARYAAKLEKAADA